MSEIFSTVVLDNLTRVEPILRERGVTIPAPLPTTSGDAFVGTERRWYRALTYIPGVTIHDGLAPESAESAGALIGRFHAALADVQLDIETPIAHFHDTQYYMDRLERVRTQYADTEKDSVLAPFVSEITERYRLLTYNPNRLPTRIIHGDLKISNVRFDAHMDAAALIDMDTLMHGTILTEMGDALRSWCGIAGEDNREQIFDRDVYEAACAGYVRTVAPHLTHHEIDSIPHGIQLLTLELAARFAMDAYEEVYFAQSSMYPTLYEQNKTRAENQLRFLNVFEKEGLV